LKWERELETAGCKGIGDIPGKTDVVEDSESKIFPRAIAFLPGSESYLVNENSIRRMQSENVHFRNISAWISLH
jgi:hypothetical protein